MHLLKTMNNITPINYNYKFLIGQKILATNIPEDIEEEYSILFSFYSGTPFYIVDKSLKNNKPIYLLSTIPFYNKKELYNYIIQHIGKDILEKLNLENQNILIEKTLNIFCLKNIEEIKIKSF